MITIGQRKIRGKLRWVVDANVSGKRSRKLFGSQAAAQSFASDQKQLVADYGGVWLALPAEVRAGLIAVYQEVTAAGHTVRGVWEAFKQSPKSAAPAKKCAEVLAEMLKAKREAARRKSYVDALDNAVASLISGREQQPIDELTAHDVETWARQAKTLSSTKTLISRAAAFFSFALRRGYITANPCERIEPITAPRVPPYVLTNDEVRKMFKWCRRHRGFLPWLVLGLLVGCRPEEADAIGWKKIHANGDVVVDVSKVQRHRRVVTPHPNALAWLRLVRKRKFKALPKTTRRRYQRDLRAHLKWSAWHKDCLRHTAATHLLNHYQDAQKVALLLGNSPGVLLTHYRGLATKQQSAEFFRLVSVSFSSPSA